MFGHYDNFVFGALFGLACGFLLSLIVFSFWNNKLRTEGYSKYSILLARLNALTNREPFDEDIEPDEEV